MNCIHLVVVGRNTEKWGGMHMGGLLAQDLDPRRFRVTWIDDASDDGSPPMVEATAAVLKEVPSMNWRLQANCYRQGGLANVIGAVRASADDEIIVQWDADDFFAVPHSLTRIMAEYDDRPDCWMTYGGYRRWPSFDPGIRGPYPSSVVHDNAFRSQAWLCEPPRSFRAWLGKAVPVEELCHPATPGCYYDSAWDFAYYMPMMELAGSHLRHIPETLYLYNEINEHSDWRLRKVEQTVNGNLVRARRVLSPLSHQASVWGPRGETDIDKPISFTLPGQD